MDSLYVIYLVFSSFGILSSVFALTVLFRSGNFKSCITLLLFWLHASFLGQEIALLPDLYAFDSNLCIAAQFFHYYFGLMNAVTILCLVEANRSILLSDPFRSRQLLHQYGSYFIVFFPMITAIPYITDDSAWISTINDDTGWCALPADAPLVTGVLVYFLWVWLSLFLSLVVLLYTAYVVLKADKMIGLRYLASVGSMLLISLLAWLPRILLLIQLIENQINQLKRHMIALLPIPLSAILFAVLFYIFERPSLKVFNEWSESRDSFRTSFTWENLDLDDLRGSDASAVTDIHGRVSNSGRIIRPSLGFMETINNPINRNTLGGISPIQTVKINSHLPSNHHKSDDTSTEFGAKLSDASMFDEFSTAQSFSDL